MAFLEMLNQDPPSLVLNAWDSGQARSREYGEQLDFF